ncbi:hypothetical protein K040078D81_34180 [Blautia hominis]|uniref:Uncharacterized protein n=1 Tax=Blautia hominis TaxID=2025493 RepID=A0ABQ0BCW0_9FIRM
MFQWSVTEIHLPQLLNEEATADEFSKWEQVSSGAAERFAHLKPTPDPPGPLLISRPPSTPPTQKRPHGRLSHRTFPIYFFIFTNFV